MSYVNLPVHLPQLTNEDLMGRGLGQEPSYEERAAAYNSCSTRNAETKQVFEQALTDWRRAKKAYDDYIVVKKRIAAANAGADSAYALRVASYNAQMRLYEPTLADWQKKKKSYDAGVAYKAAKEAEQQSQARALAVTYGITLPTTGVWWCVSQSTKAQAQKDCERLKGAVKGMGALSATDYKACFLASMPTCISWSLPMNPGPPPEAPRSPGDRPPRQTHPPAVANPGPQPGEPALIDCGPRPKAPAFGLGTAGLLAVLAVGGGVLGYRWWKKRGK